MKQSYIRDRGSARADLGEPMVADEFEASLRRCRDRLDALLAVKAPRSILEAGGGSRTMIPLDGARYTVIDLSPEQIARNSYAHDKLVGDIHDFDFAHRRFDAAVFWDVLEHLPRPIAAVENVAQALEPGGLMIIKGPLNRSVKGLITKWTPFWVHVAFHRYVRGSKNAGKPGYAPFPTALVKGSDPDQLQAELQRRGFKIALFDTYISSHVAAFKRRLPLAYALYECAAAVIRGVTAGRYGQRESDFILVASRSR
ncbi:class I SAM-dependent methyltransferase [Caulobacter endophyticus]|uniref:class I SAM-dependent methyltransferase n=1 Tax=Caulobacter endophyticus TaxID=2172652 RepID=UPI00240FFFA3|nr:class I SAM-dependent methyltransferase [Caulobacter endophyticus]MDG2528029.1 class I SAM-dependent methyltransferase [Caulobacter endophyticus]